LYSNPDGMRYRICDLQKNCIDNYSDADFKKYLQPIASEGKLIVGGNVIGTYEHLSFDDFTPFQQAFFDQMSAQRVATKGLIAQKMVDSVVAGVGGFLIGKAVKAGVEAYAAYKGAQAVASEAEGLIIQAAQTVGNKGAVAASKESALAAAEQWVGAGAKPIYKGSEIIGKVSADGQRVYRITSINKAQPYVNLVNKTTGGNLHVRF
jgi:hypothetical protein